MVWELIKEQPIFFQVNAASATVWNSCTMLMDFYQYQRGYLHAHRDFYFGKDCEGYGAGLSSFRVFCRISAERSGIGVPSYSVREIRRSFLKCKLIFRNYYNPLNPPYQGDFKRKCVSPIKFVFEGTFLTIPLL